MGLIGRNGLIDLNLYGARAVLAKDLTKGDSEVHLVPGHLRPKTDDQLAVGIIRSVSSSN